MGTTQRSAKPINLAALTELLDYRPGDQIPPGDVLTVDGAPWTAAEGSRAIVIAQWQLQDIADYRSALQRWFAAVRAGGHLVVTVPHGYRCEGEMALPVAERPEQRRLYTPGLLLAEIEEALAPDEYRVRLLREETPGDDPDTILIVLERQASEQTPVHRVASPGGRPDYAFAPERTRVEMTIAQPRHRILLMKLDHLGDFIMGLPALERARMLFRDSHITLAVGSWNREIAEDAGVADEIVLFDAFPRNSSEEEVDVPGKRAAFAAALPDAYDLAIDLRTEGDTRTLLKQVRAPIKAGIGATADHPFLDIALPIGLDRVWREAAREYRYDHHAFATQSSVARLAHRAAFTRGDVQPGQALIWGPYERLRPGRYIFDPFLEIAPGAGLLMIDVGLNGRRVVPRTIGANDALRLSFTVEEPDTAFEFRIWPVDEIPPLAFNFYGGRLAREGAPSLVHQSDYQMLLIELVAWRLDRLGVLREVDS